jgi:hypothetical protein
MVGDKILSHRGLISAEFVLGRDTAILGPCPALTPECILTVIVLCSKGRAVPMGRGGITVAFPLLSFPPDGMTSHILHLDKNSQEGTALPFVDGIPKMEQRRSKPKQLSKGELFPRIPPKECQRLLAIFNSRARYERRLHAALIKAEWDPTRPLPPGGMTADQRESWEEDEFALSTDNLLSKLEAYDIEYRFSLKQFRISLQDRRWKANSYGAGKLKTPEELARVDAGEILRQVRTENLWKCLKDHQDRGGKLLTLAGLDPRPGGYDATLDPEFPVDEYVETVLPGQLDIESFFLAGEIRPIEPVPDPVIYEPMTPEVDPDASELAAYIGTRFYDRELGFCTITGWGFSHGVAVLFYVPEDSTDHQKDEQFSSLPEVLAWMKACPISQIPDDLRPTYPSQPDEEEKGRV